MQEPKIDILKIRSLIDAGLSSLRGGKQQQRAVLVVGDTGVGKSTAISLLARKKLIVKNNGLNTVIALAANEDVKIGHNRYSQTTIPTKVVIDDLDFYDCSGFKDNRGDEYEISNSFFLQRLFTIYKQVKLLLIVDEHHISEARIDRLPKLIRSLGYSFGSLEELKNGVVLLINRTKNNLTLKNYTDEIVKMAELKGEKHFFNDEEREFLYFLVKNERVGVIQQAEEKSVGKAYETKEGQKLLAQIKKAQFIKSRKVKNVISEETKLAIRSYIDDLIQAGNSKFPRLAKSIVQQIRGKYSLNQLKEVINLSKKIIQQVGKSDGCNLLEVMAENLPDLVLGDLENDIASVVFFREIYDQSGNYFKVLKQLILTQLTTSLMHLQKQFQLVEKIEQERIVLKKQNQELVSNQKILEQQLYSQKQMKEVIVKNSQQLENAFKKKQAELEAKCLSTQKQKQSNIDRLSNQINIFALELQKKSQEVIQLSLTKDELAKLKENHNSLTQIQKKLENELATQKKIISQYKNNTFEHEKQLKKKEIQFETKIKQQLQEKNARINELTKMFEKMKIEINTRAEEIEFLTMENQSLKSQIESRQSASSCASIDSKSSKYPYVQCPHFKNGGKCRHCIKKWKDSLKQ